jgi:hypothetical protein
LARLPFALLGTLRHSGLGFAQKTLVALALMATFPARYLAGRRRADG